jgi:putative flippase GtrA
VTAAPAPGDGSLWRRLVRLAYEAVKFGAVGAVAFVVDNGLYFLLVNGPGELLAGVPVRASIVASVIATGVSYLGNRYWTFSKKRAGQGTEGAKGAAAREAGLYIAANVVGVLITGGCLYFSRWVLGFHSPGADAIARNVGIALGTIFRYVAYKFWVFRGLEKPKETP